jgi:K+-sensing histidine kinase KdpD
MLTTARQIGQRLTANPDTQKALAEFLESGRFLFNAEHCIILTTNGEAETARLLHGHQPDVSADNLPEVSLHDTMLQRVIGKGESLLLPEVRLDERYSPILEAILGFEIRQLIAVPLSARGEVLGLVGVINKNGDLFDEFDLSLLQMLAPSAAVALENAYRFAWQQAEAEQKSELYSVASHALRSPMMNILTSVEWILETGIRNKAQRTRLEDIRSQIFSLAKFAGAILDMSRIETENLRTQLLPVAITPLLKKTLAAFERRFPSHNFALRAMAHIPPAYADEAQLAIVLDHLVENAVKYSPAGSTIRVEIAASGEQVLVSVCDQGSGIMADELEDIFARYYRGRHQPAKGHSLGLGLYIARKLVQAQGGEIWAKSVVGRGSCFTFTLLQAKIGD